MTQLDPEQRGNLGAGGGRDLTSDINDADRLAAVLAIQQEITLREPGLEEVLELVVQRSLTITGASGAAIALVHEGEMICRARGGAVAPDLGAPVSADSGLSGECVRTGQTLQCDDADTDPRINREAARAMGIRSAVLVPLLHHRSAVGIFELFSAAPRGFAEQDLRIAELLGGLITSAISYSSEFEAKQALDSERSAMLRVLEQITPAIEKLLKKDPVDVAEDELSADEFASEGQAEEETAADKALRDILAATAHPSPEAAGTFPEEDFPATPATPPPEPKPRALGRPPRFTLPPDMLATPATAGIDREQEAIEAAVEILLKREHVLFPEESSLMEETQAAAEFPSEAVQPPSPAKDFFARKPRPFRRPRVSDVTPADPELASVAAPVQRPPAKPQAAPTPPTAESGAEQIEAEESLAGDLTRRARGLLQSVLAGLPAPAEPEEKEREEAEEAEEAQPAAAQPAEVKDVDLKAAVEAWVAVEAKAREAGEQKAAPTKDVAEVRALRWRNLMEFATPAAVTVVVILAGVLWLRNPSPSPPAESGRREIELRIPEPLPQPIATRLAVFGQEFESPFFSEETSAPAYGFYVGRTYTQRAPRPQRAPRRSPPGTARVTLRLAAEPAFFDLPTEPAVTVPEAVEVVRVPTSATPKPTTDTPAAPAAGASKRVQVPYQALQASVLQKVAPIYPQIALLKGATGLVVLNVVIGKDGLVKSVSAESGNEFLALAAQNAVAQWKFKPYSVNDKATEVETEIQFRFVRD